MEPAEIFKRQRTEFRRMRESPHNVVFLDVDGVLNTLAAKERSPMGYIGIQKSKVQVLHTILAQNDAVLVLSTSWKRTWSRSVPELSMNKDARYMVEQFADADVFACDKTIHWPLGKPGGLIRGPERGRLINSAPEATQRQ